MKDFKKFLDVLQSTLDVCESAFLEHKFYSEDYSKKYFSVIENGFFVDEEFVDDTEEYEEYYANKIVKYLDLNDMTEIMSDVYSLYKDKLLS